MQKAFIPLGPTSTQRQNCGRSSLPSAMCDRMVVMEEIYRETRVLEIKEKFLIFKILNYINCISLDSIIFGKIKKFPNTQAPLSWHNM